MITLREPGKKGSYDIHECLINILYVANMKYVHMESRAVYMVSRKKARMDYFHTWIFTRVQTLVPNLMSPKIMEQHALSSQLSCQKYSDHTYDPYYHQKSKEHRKVHVLVKIILSEHLLM